MARDSQNINMEYLSGEEGKLTRTGKKRTGASKYDMVKASSCTNLVIHPAAYLLWSMRHTMLRINQEAPLSAHNACQHTWPQQHLLQA